MRRPNGRPDNSIDRACWDMPPVPTVPTRSATSFGRAFTRYAWCSPSQGTGIGPFPLGTWIHTTRRNPYQLTEPERAALDVLRMAW